MLFLIFLFLLYGHISNLKKFDKIIKNVKKYLVRQNTQISCYIIGREPLVVRRPLEGGLV